MLANPPETIAAYIVETLDTLGGRPRIAGHRIAVGHVAAWRLRQGMSFEQIAATYDLPIAAVYAAMAYYHDHKAEIEARDAQNLAFAEEMRARTPSKLAAILAAGSTSGGKWTEPLPPAEQTRVGIRTRQDTLVDRAD